MNSYMNNNIIILILVRLLLFKWLILVIIKLWESKFDGIVSKRDKLQDLNTNQLKLEVHDSYKKDEKLTTNFEPNDNEDVINKGYLD